MTATAVLWVVLQQSWARQSGLLRVRRADYGVHRTG